MLLACTNTKCMQVFVKIYQRTFTHVLMCFLASISERVFDIDSSNLCVYSISVFLSFHLAIKFKAEMRNSNITESNLSVPRIAVIDAGQEK